MLPKSPWGRWLHGYLLRTTMHTPTDAYREWLWSCVTRNQFLYVIEHHKYLGVVFHVLGTNYTTPRRITAVAVMVFVFGMLVCARPRQPRVPGLSLRSQFFCLFC